MKKRKDRESSANVSSVELEREKAEVDIVIDPAKFSWQVRSRGQKVMLKKVGSACVFRPTKEGRAAPDPYSRRCSDHPGQLVGTRLRIGTAKT